MNENDIYTQWIARRRRAEVPEDFSRRVMEALPQPQALPRDLFFSSLPGVKYTLARWATAIFLLLAGLLRLSYVTTCLLKP